MRPELAITFENRYTQDGELVNCEFYLKYLETATKHTTLFVGDSFIEITDILEDVRAFKTVIEQSGLDWADFKEGYTIAGKEHLLSETSFTSTAQSDRSMAIGDVY